MAEIRINATGGVKLYDADDSHYAQIVAGTITSNTDVMTLGHAAVVMGTKLDMNGNNLILDADADTYLDGGTADDVVDVYVAGAKDWKWGANSINILSGTTLTIDSGATITNSGTANGFGALAGIDDQSSSNDDQLTISDTAVIINEDSDDLDFRVESNSNANMLTVDGGDDRVGIITAPDLGRGLHIRHADSGADVHSNSQDLVVEFAGHGGMSLLGGTSGECRFMFGDSGDNDVGSIVYEHSTNDMRFTANATETMRIQDTGQIATGGETAADAGAGGLTLDQNAVDTGILTMKSSDVGHGMTAVEETDTYAVFGKYAAADGGLLIKGYSEQTEAIMLKGAYVHGDTTHTASGTAPVWVQVYQKDGTNIGTPAANENMFAIAKETATIFIVDEDGDIFYDGAAAAFDEYDDAQLVRTMATYRAPDAIIQSKFDKFIKYNRQDLIDANLMGDVSLEDEIAGKDKPLISLTGMQKLHNGAIWQQYEKHEQLLEAVYDLAKEAVGEEKANAILDKHEIKRLQ